MANSISVNLFLPQRTQGSTEGKLSVDTKNTFRAGRRGAILHGRDARAYTDYFFLSTRKRANDFSVSACAPKLSSEVKALSTSASAFFSD